MAGVHTRRNAVPRPGITTRDVLGSLFVVMILLVTYDKSGVTIGLGDRAIIVTPYKLTFLTLAALCALASLARRHRPPDIDRRLYHLLVAFVVLQTLASLAGLIVAPGAITLSSEAYYLIQRLHVLFIPLVALRCRISPRSVLKLFVAAVVMHLLFVGVQFAAPGVYRSLVDYVFDPQRLDNTYEWDGRVLAYLGLYRTANYGAFAAAFGLLALAFSPRGPLGRALRATLVAASIGIALTGGSRSVFLMTLAGLSVFAMKTRVMRKTSSYVLVALLALAFAGSTLFFTPRLESLRSVYAFVDPDREGSNQGKLMVVDYAAQLFVQSPIVGWGSRRFADISAPLGNDFYANAEVHSQVLSTLLQTGLVGLTMYCAVFVAIVRRLWRRRQKDYAIVAGMFIGLGLYNIIYDAGALDVFALFNGVAAYYALTYRKDQYSQTTS
ncbi:MAG: hypothetical protein A3H95_16090 [Acidobacteria bacterium RIFCSPLOWO2_02_FULL_64_15]|nr:MAG: hypothetical protein A3H95_16090 [Acidobacteria bacterium RIFCSPLOWO2_02_FULL_64_15]